MRRQFPRSAWAPALALVLLAGSPVLLGTAARAAETTILRGGLVIPVEGAPLDGGAVIFTDGKITAVLGADAELPTAVDAIDVDCTGKIVMPGLFDAYTQLGLVEIGMVAASRDTDEAVAPLTPAVHTADGINLESSLFRVTRINGITSALVAPSEGNLVPGRSCVIALAGARIEDLVRRPHVGLHASLGSPPTRRYREKNQSPSTRMGSLAMLRAALVKAQAYVDKWARHEAKLATDPDASPPDRDLEIEAWQPVLRKETPFLVRAQRVSDIRAAMRLATEFDVRLVLVRATEAWKVADELAAAKIPILFGPVTQQPETVETGGARYDAAALLHAAGVDFAIVTGGAHNVRNLPYEAGLAVAHGLPEAAAIEAITLAPARILGLGSEVGSLKAGKSADVIVLDGPVIQPRARVLRMWIRGQEVELTSRQTELAERHR